MRNSYKLVLAMLGAQAGAFILVLLVGGFAKFGTISAPTPHPTPTVTVTKIPAPVISTRYVTAKPTNTQKPKHRNAASPSAVPSTSPLDGIPGLAPSSSPGSAASSSASARSTAASQGHQ